MLAVGLGCDLLTLCAIVESGDIVFRQEPTYTTAPPATSSWAAKTRSGSRPPPAPLCKADTHLKRVARIADYAFKTAALREPQGEGPDSGDACGDGRSSRCVVAPVRDVAGRRGTARVRSARVADGGRVSSLRVL